MLVRIVNSGSDGNCVIVEDNNKNQILLDCGLSYDIIVQNTNLSMLNAVCLTHYH